MTGTNLSNEDLQAAIVSSLVKSGFFQRESPGGASHTVEARIVSIQRPAMGFTFTVDLEVAWIVTRKGEGTPLLRKALKSSHTLGVGDAFVGATRLRMAVEGATKKNIEMFLAELGAAR